MRYITFDEAGNLTGCYLQDLHADHRDRHIECTEAQAANWVNLMMVRGKLAAKPPAAPKESVEPKATKQELLAEIDALKQRVEALGEDK